MSPRTDLRERTIGRSRAFKNVSWIKHWDEEKEDSPNALQRTNTGDDAHLVLEAGPSRGVLEVRTDALEPSESPPAVFVVAGHGGGRERWVRRGLCACMMLVQ